MQEKKSLGRVRRHPLATTLILIGVVIAAMLTVMGMRTSADG